MLIGFVWESNDVTYVQCLELCMGHNNMKVLNDFLKNTTSNKEA